MEALGRAHRCRRVRGRLSGSLRIEYMGRWSPVRANSRPTRPLKVPTALVGLDASRPGPDKRFARAAMPSGRAIRSGLRKYSEAAGVVENHEPGVVAGVGGAPNGFPGTTPGALVIQPPETAVWPAGQTARVATELCAGTETTGPCASVMGMALVVPVAPVTSASPLSRAAAAAGLTIPAARTSASDAIAPPVIHVPRRGGCPRRNAVACSGLI